MVNYTCQKCNKTFTNKTVYDRHCNMKKDCRFSKTTVEDIVKTDNENVKNDESV